MPTRRMPPARCSDDSIGSTGCQGTPIPARPKPIAAISASSWTETGDKERSMHHHTLTAAQRRAAYFCVRGVLFAGLAAAVAGCNTTATDTTGGIPQFYRERHPISVKEGKKTLVLFVGSGR